MDFSVKWAGAGAAYAGMIFGVVMGLRLMPGPGGVMIGLFFGGAMALPLVLTHWIAALTVGAALRGASFGAQFSAFAVAALLLDIGMVQWLNELFRSAGGLFGTPANWTAPMLFYLASLAVSLACMIVWPEPARG
ncbi:hypothetical protein [Sphingomonas sp.]|uniref:hypothetical protein n=1 Tax=Sphingomonas sp. TaxID=28214 RepID=UPI001B02380B|nr:hypothetical protein [Sphingomonas sp.]MBO9712044.1 hypothetical protein [Sphingomonas sp.]